VSYVYNIIVDFFANYTFQLIGAFIIFALGYMLAGRISNVVLNLSTKHKLDITLSQFLASNTRILIVIIITVISLSKLGISVTPFIAAIGEVSLGAGLAHQGLLANYAAGFNIILIRPSLLAIQ
jgi:small conductance mechanosensitive channel